MSSVARRPNFAVIGQSVGRWAGALLYAALGIAGATMLVQVGRLLRSSWNP